MFLKCFEPAGQIFRPKNRLTVICTKAAKMTHVTGNLLFVPENHEIPALGADEVLSIPPGHAHTTRVITINISVVELKEPAACNDTHQYSLYS